jgi:hypothetical protein
MTVTVGSVVQVVFPEASGASDAIVTSIGLADGSIIVAPFHAPLTRRLITFDEIIDPDEDDE